MTSFRAALCNLFIIAASVASAQASFKLAPPVFAASLPAPRVVLAGDVNGDGRADLIDFYAPENGILDVLRMSALGKPMAPVRARTGLGKDALAAASGIFAEPKRASVIILLPNGELHLLHDAGPNGAYAKDDLVATLPPALRPKPPVRAIACDFYSTGRSDLLLIGADGRMTRMTADFQPSQPAHFRPVLVHDRLRDARRITVGDVAGCEGPHLIWLDSRGRVRHARLSNGGDQCWLLDVRTLTTADPDDLLVAGRFLGEEQTDLLVGHRLFPGGVRGGEFLPEDRHKKVTPPREIPVEGLPEHAAASGDFAWIAADCDGDGRDDLIRVRHSGDRFTGDDVLISFSRPGLADSSGDGLLDAWKTGDIKPGGLDLAALGCRVGRRDIIVEVQRTDDTPDARVHADMERAVRYFAGLPVENPDGSTGITLHVIYREPIAQADRGRSWWDLGARYHPQSHRGITHWMVVYNGGGGQSGEMTDRGGCGVHALYATFIHEFGHQLGLPHEGFWRSGGCPIYPSLMNYTYSYQLGGKPDAICYSDGRLAGIVLNEAHLDEHLPLPPDQVAFLAGPPYHYHIKPDPENGGTLVDWNWDGVFGEKDVAAAINYGYGTTAGLRHTIGKTYAAPALATIKNGRSETLLCFAGRLPDGAPLPPADGSAQHPGLAQDNPGRLRVRTWLGRNPQTDGPKWSDETDLEPSGVTGDPSAASLDGAAWVAYPTLQGIVLRRVTPLSHSRAGRMADGRGAGGEGSPSSPPHLITLSPPQAVPNSANAQPTLVTLGRRLALLIWRDANTPIGLRLLTVRKDHIEIGPEQPLGFTSLCPVGGAAGAKTHGGESLWVAVTQNQDAARTSRWQVRRLELKGETVTEAEREWVGGEKGQERGSGRVMLLWEPDRTVGPGGRLYVLSAGMYTAKTPWQCHFVAMRIGDRTVNGGWLTRRYYDEWTQSRSAPGACWFRGDIAFASRWMGNVHGTENDNLFVGFYGRGISSEPMGDFNDISFIRDVGLRHSIPWLTQ